MFFLICLILMKFKEFKRPFLITGIKHTRGHVTHLIHLSRMWAVDYFSLLPRRLGSDVSRKCEWKRTRILLGEKYWFASLLTRLPFPDDPFAPAKVKCHVRCRIETKTHRNGLVDSHIHGQGRQEQDTRTQPSRGQQNQTQKLTRSTTGAGLVSPRTQIVWGGGRTWRQMTDTRVIRRREGTWSRRCKANNQKNNTNHC